MRISSKQADQIIGGEGFLPLRATLSRPARSVNRANRPLNGPASLDLLSTRGLRSEVAGQVGSRREGNSPRGDRSPPLLDLRERIALAALLLLTFALRAARSDQPIVENYVGRQVPTAMVARNLERGSGFLWPQLDTAPFPNLFLVEPPIYELIVVAVHRRTRLALEPAGRIVSALAIALAAWGIFGLVLRRERSRVAFLTLAAFALFPLTIRYGRAFQPDALMLGTMLAGLYCWDEYEATARLPWLAAGCVFLALALAIKVTAAYVLVPLVVAIMNPRRRWKLALALSLILPAAFWYLHASSALAQGAGSAASADNRAIWLQVLIPSALFRLETARNVVRFLVVRAFTPLGFALAVWGLRNRAGGDRLWWVWGASALATLALLAGKLHHEYYWLAVAPLAAVGVGKALSEIVERWGRPWAIAASACLMGLSMALSVSTWRTPAEWSGLSGAAEAIRGHVPEGEWVVAPEALLFASDRRGCRLEWGERSVSRAAGEWGGALEGTDPLALVEFYRARGARFVADVAADGDPTRLALHDAVRRRYNVLVDQPGVLLAALSEPKDAPHGRR